MQRFNRKFRGGCGPKLWSQESNGSWPVRIAHCDCLGLSRYESRRTFHARIGSGISPGDCAVVSSRPCECGENQWTLSGAIQAAPETTAGPASDMQLSSVSFPSLVSKALRPWAKSYGTASQYPSGHSGYLRSCCSLTSSWPTQKWWVLDWRHERSGCRHCAAGRPCDQVFLKELRAIDLAAAVSGFACALGSLSAAARLLKEVARTVLPWRPFGGDQAAQIEGLRRRWVLLANAVVAVPAPAQSDIVRVTPIIDNERVTVWDITLSQGQSMAFRRHENDFVTMFLAGARFRPTNENGRTTVPERQFGEVVYGRKGTEQKDEVNSGVPRG